MPDYYNYNQNSGQTPMYNPPQYQPQAGMEPPPGYVQKSRMAAGVLAILLGTYGIHSFYLGNTSRGLLQLLLSLFTCGVGAIIMFIWGIVDGVRPHQHRCQWRIFERLTSPLFEKENPHDRL